MAKISSFIVLMLILKGWCGIAFNPMNFLLDEITLLSKSALKNVMHYVMSEQMNFTSMRTLSENFIYTNDIEKRYNILISDISIIHAKKYNIHENDFIILSYAFTDSKYVQFIISVDNFFDQIQPVCFAVDGSSKILMNQYISYLKHDTPLRKLETPLINNKIDNCNNYISNDLVVFLIHVRLIIVEMKILALFQCSSVLSLADYTTQVALALNFSMLRKTYFHEYLANRHTLNSRRIYRCNIYMPQRHVNFLEFCNYNRALLFTASVLGGEGISETYKYCNVKCENLNVSLVERTKNVQIFNLQTVGKIADVQFCPPISYTDRTYSWWKNSTGMFGPQRTCSDEMKFIKWNWFMRPECYACLGSVIAWQPIRSTDILRISTVPQVSDFKNNMIVVGVKFVTHKRSINLQIQQTKFSHPSSTFNNLTEWRNVNASRNEYKKWYYMRLARYLGRLYLDDVILPPQYVVTGVRFSGRNHIHTGIYLEVHGTPFDLKTGQLKPHGSQWFSPLKNNTAYISDYAYDRSEIKIDDPDNPSMCRDYDSDEGTNKFIRFRHSSIKKDAGQNTVPHIDAQSVETYPFFPLGGVGLFYRAKKGCGGYVAPRIFTADFIPLE